MNFEVREDVSMLTAISPIQPTPIALPVEQDGSGHRETIIPLSPKEDSAGFSGTAGGLSDNGTFVAPQAASPSVILAQTREARPSSQPSTNHAISSPRYRSVLEAASPKNRNLPKAVLEDIEFYTLHGNLGVTTQRQLLKAKYPNHQLPARDIASAVQKFKGGTDLKGLDNDAAKLWIWELARRATQIAVDQQDNSLEELLRRYIREKEDRIGRQTSQTAPQ
ncbi:261_t:CDS:2 [Cetraspora pellucida]|uniref:261_t:CDS:1 n=1 Tax=Cetraspora pellucida TaxID=1433469 RepID=A0A9N9BGJ7_9GLOM|nr:261_t:CDS:2 [Cetraspora pellucida]